ncbi:MAG: PEP-CTERM sorting domain-containing protein [Pirellulales bacterium]
MRIKDTFLGVVCLATLALMVSPSVGQVLYTQDFDVDDTANWTQNLSGVTDSNAVIFFDYSSVGIPAAPNSSGGSTRGMKLQANLFSNAFGGFSVSPTGESFTGDYVLSYDMWQSYHGVSFVEPVDIFPAGGGIIRGQSSGGTNLGYGGILSSGTFSNSAGSSDSVFFSATGDGDSGSDYRVYSSDRDYSYQSPPVDAIDEDATYFGGSRNAASSTLYTDNFGGESPTAAQAALFPNEMVLHPDNVTDEGVIGFAWREHTITKLGDTVTWAVDGIDLIQLDISNFAIPTGGNNILFGHGDINNGSSGNAQAFDLLFTLVDNVKVEVATLTVEDADFNGNGKVDGDDFLTWQRGNGIMGAATLADGDANGDQNVDGADLGILQEQFGTGVPASASVGAVPEPASMLMVALGLACLAGSRFRR